MRKITSFIYISIFCLLSTTVNAASLYVTDRVLLGVHQQPAEDSAIIQSIPSGTAVQLIEKEGDFTKVKLVNGVEGWVSSQFLMNEQPSTARFDKLFSENQKNMETLKSVNETLAKRERDLQILRDELSNAKHTIKELKKNGGTTATETTTTVAADPEQEQKLAEAEAKVSELTKQLEQLKTQTSSTDSQADTKAALKYAEEENAALQARIALALSNLSGEKAPSPEELAGIRPKFPLWYWLLMVIALAVGVAGGVMWMDYQSRKRHGGFRV